MTSVQGGKPYLIKLPAGKFHFSKSSSKTEAVRFSVCGHLCFVCVRESQ
jgi:hypothetical protein